jgi:hypothetical protein
MHKFRYREYYSACLNLSASSSNINVAATRMPFLDLLFLRDVLKEVVALMHRPEWMTLPGYNLICIVMVY